MLARKVFATALLAVMLIVPAQAGVGAVGETARPASPECGTAYAPPFGDPAPRRTCDKPIPRKYKATYNGVGYDILDRESEACFVPDSSYRLLDQIVDRVTARLTTAQRTGKGISKEARAVAVSQATGDVLSELGFGLYIPTETLGDALVSRNPSGMPPRFIFDCDTGSMILLTVADHLQIPASLVEITLESGSQHNYVRWPLEQSRSLDWDMNGRAPCITPTNQPAFQGRSMSRLETTGYAAFLRASLWKNHREYVRALSDYREDMRDRPAHPVAFNNFAWLIATTDFLQRQSYKDAALEAATKAVALQRQSGAPKLARIDLANYLDTLACVYASRSEYGRANTTEMEALSISAKPEFKQRQEMFIKAVPADCTGAH